MHEPPLLRLPSDHLLARFSLIFRCKIVVRACHIALGVCANGAKAILALWLEQNEGAKFRLRVMNALRLSPNRPAKGPPGA